MTNDATLTRKIRQRNTAPPVFILFKIVGRIVRTPSENLRRNEWGVDVGHCGARRGVIRLFLFRLRPQMDAHPAGPAKSQHRI